MDYNRDAQLLHKCSSHFKILGVIRATRGRVHTEDPPIIGPTVHLVVGATRRQEFVNHSVTILNSGKADTTSKRYVPYILKIYRAQHCVTRVNTSTLGCRFATVRFTTIHFYDPRRVGALPTCDASLSELKCPSLITLPALSRCACVSSFYILVQFF
jgi:hypothetical protein